MSSVLNPSHAPVMHDEVIAGLEIKPKGRYVDGTYGRGGHARSILAELDQEILMILRSQFSNRLNSYRLVCHMTVKYHLAEAGADPTCRRLKPDAPGRAEPISSST